MNDLGVELIHKELEFVNDELSVAVGLSGPDRKISDPAETHAPADRQGDSFSTNGIREHDPSLAHHPSACTRTGYYCAYLPDPRQPTSWKL